MMGSQFSGPPTQQPPFPAISRELLDRLCEVFPDRLPSKLDYTDRDVAIAVGTQLVITKLQLEYARQTATGVFQRGERPPIDNVASRYLGR